MSASKVKEYKALIKLIDEPNLDDYNIIKQRILEIGFDIYKYLKDSLDNNFQEDNIFRILDLMNLINVDRICKEFKKWKDIGSNNLLHGLYILSLFRNPLLKIEEIKIQIDSIKDDIWLEMNSNLTLLEKIRVFNHVFYDIYGFKPNKLDFHNPSNSFVFEALERKTANPIMISSIYIIIAQKLGLPVYGVNLPEHFVCVVLNQGLEDRLSFLPKGEPLFYINPFDYGSVFTVNQLKVFLAQIKVPEKPEYFLSCNNIDILNRCLNNLIFTYSSLNEEDKVIELKRIKSILT